MWGRSFRGQTGQFKMCDFQFENSDLRFCQRDNASRLIDKFILPEELPCCAIPKQNFAPAIGGR
jgi:hypothetical protein